ncbi:Prolyl 3-hydroxylase 1, partial [Linum perenne]
FGLAQSLLRFGLRFPEERRRKWRNRKREKTMEDDNCSNKIQNEARLIIPDFLSFQECQELEFIHRSCSTLGYRPNVFSTTLSHLIATNSSHLIVPFLSIRERLKDKVEEFFHCEYELCVEFTGLISWTRGASIGWHTDDNRPYLKQRHFTAVCYLNTYGEDFKGGLFRFQDGHPITISPMAGVVSIYTADDRNVHSVDEIFEGERLTLAMWFSRDSTYDEDAKLISLLSSNMACPIRALPDELPQPMPASSNMYWFCPDAEQNQESGFDICCARIRAAGFDIYSSLETLPNSDFSALLLQPLQLAMSTELFENEFANILHALQAVQFYCWKAPKLADSRHVGRSKVRFLSELQQEEIASMKSMFVKDNKLADKTFFSGIQHDFNWAKFTAAVDELECYTRKLQKELLISLPHWRTDQIIYKVPLKGLDSVATQ